MNENLNKLLDYAEKKGIEIHKEERLDAFGKSALYCSFGNKNIILTSNLFEYKNVHEKIEIIAEELGHYATSVGDDFKQEYRTSADKIKHDKSEEKAMRWGYDFLIDEKKLADAILKSASQNDVCEKMQLSIDIINKYLYYYSLKNPIFKLNDTKALNLIKLPSWILVDL